jgi:2Fe-2S ferredoxin
MSTLTILPSNMAVEAAQGANILQAVLAAGVEAAHKCGGEGRCGTCHIFVHEGRKSLSKVQRLENEKLDAIVGVGSKSRLACQAVVGTDDVTIELLGFASGI